MKSLSGHHSDLEAALRTLSIVIKAVRFYPPGHPALQAALGRAEALLSRLFANSDNIAFSVRKDRFFYQDAAVSSANPVLQKLAHHLFIRRVQQILFLPEIDRKDIEKACRYLALEPEDIIRRGGLPRLFAEASLSTIWINETDLGKILAVREKMREDRTDEESFSTGGKKQTLSADHFHEKGSDTTSGASKKAVSPESLEQPPGRRSVQEILDELRQDPPDKDFRSLVRELLSTACSLSPGTGLPQILAALLYLGQGFSDKNLADPRREICRSAFEDLLTPEVSHALISSLCDPKGSKDIQEKAFFLLHLLNEHGADLLADRLAEEPEAQKRKILAGALARFGGAALPALERLLRDERWYVVRNAAAILGELREPGKIFQLAKLLGHSDRRVRREVIRALTRIGTAEAMDVLLITVEDGDEELQKQALLFLGAMKQRRAVPYLLRFVRRRDIFMRRAELKRGAIRALGEIGAEEAILPLAQVLLKRRLIYSRRFREMQVAAGQALARIGTPEALRVLDKVAREGSGVVSRTAAHVLQLKQSDKKNEP